MIVVLRHGICSRLLQGSLLGDIKMVLRFSLVLNQVHLLVLGGLWSLVSLSLLFGLGERLRKLHLFCRLLRLFFLLIRLGRTRPTVCPRLYVPVEFAALQVLRLSFEERFRCL